MEGGGERIVSSDSQLGFPELELIESGLGSASFHYGHFVRGIQIWCLKLKEILFSSMCGLNGWMDGWLNETYVPVRLAVLFTSFVTLTPRHWVMQFAQKNGTPLQSYFSWSQTHRYDTHILRFSVTYTFRGYCYLWWRPEICLEIIEKKRLVIRDETVSGLVINHIQIPYTVSIIVSNFNYNQICVWLPRCEKR